MKDYQEPDIAKSDVPTHNLIGAVRYALAGSSDVNAGSITVNAANGVVYLVGAVDTLHEKQTAGRLALGAPGVSYVENNLVVSPTKPSDDHRLLALAQDALANYPPGDPTTIGVRAVESGQAYITGTAEHAAEARRAMEIVESVPGIRRVIDEIVIAPGVPIDEVDLMNNVLDRFNTDPRLHTAGIVIDADRGTVYLSGEVQNEDMAESAGELASQARGVQHVINRLRVVR